ncbi:tyrosine integrase [Gordonia phage UmaThurman]|uniref:tyrosine integrase n=1 Tax=Gordonia phage UmaThurman TaxID=1821563 RepID=UPI00078D548C|nr:tyrosine integrase [Gordonia phage UmaThurman]AMS03935.1 tyrosine integrase [Gordonia phage UmaThurman]
MLDSSEFHRGNSLLVKGMMQPQNTGLPKTLPLDWIDFVADFLAHLRAAGHPKTTVETRRQHVSRLARGISCAPEAVTLDILIGFYGSQTWSTEYRRGHRNTAAVLFGWAYDTGRIATNPAAKLPRVPAAKPAPRPAPDRVVAESKLAADARTLVMLRLASELGMRRAEVACCSTNDLIEGFDGWQLLVHGKGGKKRIVPISDDLAKVLRAGPGGHSPGAGRTGYLFPGDDGGHLSPRWVGTLCARVMPGVWTMHTLRHRAGTRAYRGTRNLRAVQELLGHGSLASAQRYLAVDDSEVREAMMAAA